MEKIEMEKKKDFGNMVFIIFIAILLLVGLVLTIYYIIDLSIYLMTDVKTYTIKTISSNEENIFVLGVGNLGNDEYFVCYKEDENGSLIIKTFSSENTTICKTLESDEEAYAEITTTLSGTKNKIYVPKDTIQVEYNLSLTE